MTLKTAKRRNHVSGLLLHWLKRNGKTGKHFYVYFKEPGGLLHLLNNIPGNFLSTVSMISTQTFVHKLTPRKHWSCFWHDWCFGGILEYSYVSCWLMRALKNCSSWPAQKQAFMEWKPSPFNWKALCKQKVASCLTLFSKAWQWVKSPAPLQSLVFRCVLFCAKNNKGSIWKKSE